MGMCTAHGQGGQGEERSGPNIKIASEIYYSCSRTLWFYSCFQAHANKLTNEELGVLRESLSL